MTHHESSRSQLAHAASAQTLSTQTAQAPIAQTATFDDRIWVGVIQRFGENLQAKLTVRDAGGGSVRVSFTQNGQTVTRNLDALTLTLTTLPVNPPTRDDRLVLSVHRSFENAEASAKSWRERGIPTEIAQPGEWEVWADRQVYDAPVLRQLLLESLQQAGHTETIPIHQSRSQRLIPTWKINGAPFQAETIEIEPSSGAAKVEYGSKTGSATPERYTYGGTFRLQPNAYGTYTLVNHVSIETYLRGVVPYEIGTGAPEAAIAAQAIIARTYALRNLHRFAIDNYELCADTHCQAYWGLEGATAVTDRAIAATAGQVLTYENQPIDALYSSTTGGVTAPFADIWSGENRPYLKAIIDSLSVQWNLTEKPLSDEKNLREFIALEKNFNESEWQPFRWREKASLPEITNYFKRYLKRGNRPINFTKIQEVAVQERSQAGRILAMKIKTDTGEIIIPGDEIRSAFYPPTSTFFYLNPIYEPDRSTAAGITNSNKSSTAKNSEKNTKEQRKLWGYEFVGGGFGHGVGLSQTGAYNLARAGKSGAEILQFYYPGTELKPIDQIDLPQRLNLQ